MQTVTAPRSGAGLFWPAILIILMLSVPGAAQAADQVTGRYLKDSGRIITMELDIPAAPPASIIVSQRVPPDVTVQRTNPPAKKTTAEGLVKWLLVNVHPGRSSITMELDRTVTPGEVQGQIRYRDPATSRPVTTAIAPAPN